MRDGKNVKAEIRKKWREEGKFSPRDKDCGMER